ncbi:putative inner membrane protein translocase component YidC [Blattabacterium sp. (Blattella germanica) str. Bge]|uniref:membrane protein insertase YidC n=1 Tax=Blattabacterium sp. (Blattella germanica) TaxID=624186 RepID=UPI0001BB6127|nr:membrane protein insertase YidC [Blattabacterium sp. (Blattella germanica)]ACY40241.1 putative inner membrane protein translocase component YidC [Blattabacterium sp. (Blattella germanica) str. Bge]
MKDKNLDYSSMIGLFLILLILTIFTYFNSNNNNKNKEQEKKFLKNKEFLNSKKGYFFEKEKNHFFLLENNVLRLKISNVGGMINEVLLKKYKAYDASLLHHSKNLFLIKNSSFLYKMSFSNKKGLNIDTTNLLFQPFLFENQKKRIQILIMRAKNPYGNGKGFLDYIYTIGKNNQYDIGFSVRTINFYPFKKLVSINLEQKILSLEKDRNWENSYTQVYYSVLNKNSVSVKHLSEKKTEETNISNMNWIAHKQQFFASIFVPEKKFQNIFVRSENFSSGNSLKNIQFKTLMNANKNEEIHFSFRFYFGPLDFNLLKGYKNGFENIIPFGWGFLKWINKYFFLIIFQFLEQTSLNYGVIIILMTFVVKLILYPITYKQYKLSAIMKLIRPEVEELNNKYKNNEDAFKKQKAMMELYKKVGINPMSGCISTLFQIPIFYSLFKFFPTLLNLRGKSFLWVEDLTSYDSILELPFFIPFYGNHISLLTLLYALALLVYTKLSNNEKKDISQNENGTIPDMSFILYLMPVIMLLFINSYASALSLYYFTSNIINIGFLFFIKEFMLDEKKILIKIQENKINIKKT